MRALTMLGDRIRRRIDRLIWGADAVRCEECGRSVRPGRAVWRGTHPYCSVEHEVADTW